LRFKEFEGEWEKKKLGKLLTIGNGKDYKHLGLGDVPVYGTGGLMTKVDDFLYDGETVCIGRKGTIDKPMYFNGKIWTVDTLFYTHSFKSATPKFVYNLFQRVNWKQHNEAGGVPSLSKSTIEQIELTLPQIDEQKKIASFLSLIDERIQTQNKIIQQLETSMQGLREKLFKQQIRFKDYNGNDFPDWEVKRLGDVLSIQGGYAFKSNLFNSGIAKVIRIGDIIPSIKLLSFKGVFSSEIPNEKYIVKNNDFIMALSGATFGKVGKIRDIGFGYINQRVATFRTKQCLEFYYQLVQTENFINYVHSIPTASAQPNISNDDIINYKSTIPQIEEQILIANFLSSIDEKIETEKEVLQQYENQKKYLLQNLFI
jgi:type I restriction enzyme S subunit